MKAFSVLFILVAAQLSAMAQQECTAKFENDPALKKLVADAEAGNLAAPYKHTYLLYALVIKYCDCVVTAGQYKAIVEDLKTAANEIRRFNSALPEIPTNANYKSDCDQRSNADIVALTPNTSSSVTQTKTKPEKSRDCVDRITSSDTYMRYVNEAGKGSAVASSQAAYVLFGLSLRYCHCYDNPDVEAAFAGAMRENIADIKKLGGSIPELPTGREYESGCAPKDNNYIAALLKPQVKTVVKTPDQQKTTQPEVKTTTSRQITSTPPSTTTTTTTAEPASLSSLGITKVPKYYALVIGVSKYQYPSAGLANLDMPVKDAEKFADVLTRNYYFEKGNVTILRNATREQIINQLDYLAETLTEKDNLLIFYAGHGYYDKPKDFGYWLPADAKTSTRSAWIANSTIRDYMSAIKTKHTLLITDACFGGSILKSRSVETTIQRFTEQYREPSRKAMTSGNLTVVSDKSVFLQFLLKKLEDNTDVFLSAPQLFARIYEPIMNNAPSTPVFGPIQGAGDGGGDFIFIRRDVK